MNNFKFWFASVLLIVSLMMSSGAIAVEAVEKQPGLNLYSLDQASVLSIRNLKSGKYAKVAIHDGSSVEVFLADRVTGDMYSLDALDKVSPPAVGDKVRAHIKIGLENCGCKCICIRWY